ncbi:hypothetical protein D3C77_681980 [compost metagenome]
MGTKRPDRMLKHGTKSPTIRYQNLAGRMATAGAGAHAVEGMFATGRGVAATASRQVGISVMASE